MIPNAQNALLQPRLMASPPVIGVMNANEFGCVIDDPRVELGGLAGGVGMTAVTFPTVTWKLPKEVLPAASVAEQLTVVVPRLKVKPEAGEQATDTDASRLSVTEAK